MVNTTLKPQWRRRMAHIQSHVDQIYIPDLDGKTVSQDEEWCYVMVAGKQKRIRFHDYHEIYAIPGLYEKLFYDRLQCCSPSRVVGLLADVLVEFEEDPGNLRVLDLGAGNGMVGDELSARQVQKIVGIDILPEAKEAAYRDRPGIYDNYLVAGVTNLAEAEEAYLRRQRFNCLITVATLGFSDIPPDALLQALDLVDTPSWVALTIKEDFLRGQDDSGFAALIGQLSSDEIIQIQAYRRFRHRLSITGQPLYYVAMVARKLTEVPDALTRLRIRDVTALR